VSFFLLSLFYHYSDFCLRPVSRPKLLTFDHIHPAQALSPPTHTAILYASLSSKNFRGLHNYLLSLASKPVPQIEYVLRHIPPATRTRDTTTNATIQKVDGNYLSGYGVALDMKKMDYLAVDDRHASSNGSCLAVSDDVR
jgi:UDP-glucose:glycoprotein glucosyltransferase